MPEMMQSRLGKIRNLMHQGPTAWAAFAKKKRDRIARKFFDKIHGGPSTFDEFLKLEKKYLNIGAFDERHPHRKYANYVCVTVPASLFQFRLVNSTGELEDNSKAVSFDKGFPPSPPYVIYHDVRSPFPLPNGSVDRIHSEDCFEHIEQHQYVGIFDEFYRILKPGSRFRLCVPDYNNPKDAFCLEKGFDPRNPGHVTLTTCELMKGILEKTKFETIKYYHYWENGVFRRNEIDYSLGYVSRTPDNSAYSTQKDPLRVTSLVVDLIKA